MARWLQRVFLLFAASVCAEEVSFGTSWSSYVGAMTAFDDETVASVAVNGSDVLFAGTLGDVYLRIDDDFFADASNGDEAFNLEWRGFVGKVPAGSGTPSLWMSGLEIDSCVTDTSGETVAVGENSGAWMQWGESGSTFSLEEDGRFNSVALAGDVAYIAGWTSLSNDTAYPGAIVCAVANDGTEKWTRFFGKTHSLGNASAIAYHNGAVYAGANDSAGMGVLLALDAGTGNQLREPFNMTGGVAGLAVRTNGTLAVASGSRLLYVESRQIGFSITSSIELPGAAVAVCVDESNRVAVAGNTSEHSAYAAIYSEKGEQLFLENIANTGGKTEARSIAFANGILALGGCTAGTDLFQGGFCTENLNEAWDEILPTVGFIKVWTGEEFVPDPPGVLGVQIFPEGTGAWSFDGGKNWLEGNASTNLQAGAYTVVFRDEFEMITPESQTANVVSGKETWLTAYYDEAEKPPVTRFVDGTNVTLRVIIPVGCSDARIQETLDTSLAVYTDETIGRVRPKYRVTFTFEFDEETTEVQTYWLKYSFSGELGVYSVAGSIEMTNFDGFDLVDETEVQGPTELEIAPEKEPPSPDIVAFARDGDSWLLTFVSIAGENYSIRTNSSPHGAFADMLSVQGKDGTTSVRLSSDEPKLFFRVICRP